MGNGACSRCASHLPAGIAKARERTGPREADGRLLRQRLPPRSAANASSDGCSLSIAARKPCGPSIAPLLAVIPACASIAASLLKKEGFNELWNVPGSWEAWKKAGFPVEK